MPHFRDGRRRPVVVAALRTPVGRAGGALAGVRAEDLLAPVLRAVLDASGARPEEIDDVVIGNAAGGGGNVARLAALTAGLPVGVPGVTVDRQCGSGLEAVMLAARLVAAGAGDCYLAGGVESTSTAPWRAERPERPMGMPRFYARARFSPESIGDPEMGVAAENVARAYGISRERQDAFALRSHRRAVAAAQAGRFAAETVPITVPAGVRRRGERVVVDTDECPRSGTSAAALAALRPAFAEGGTVTAGNSCPLNDGASAMLVTTADNARRLVEENRRRGRGEGSGGTALLGFVDGASAGVDPNLLGIGPVESTRRLVARNPGLVPGATAVEFNEAFAAQVLASLDELGIDEEEVNPDGGAIALGHPYGASGAILVTRLYTRLARDPAPVRTRGMAMLGIAGGLGLTALFERVEV
ncbi:acetyl-CoA C-acetyltransferase [Streptosporangium becharense]|uniref:Acetyl-CoA C-acetyltransferase n=1 Tax=Streptosporangium becharense TaxID=1816182 RepID=A0A7W9IB00_9ACTN|nr:thiolase family protein [Streptosporangium becharense]MBB2910717.1 acetyl-CoA C-acetyltransferase [Streptosporangium becharense]MBB5817412.1 acetyl-CoA C-acetyltransferase [Streptosporangium becharense]